MQQYWQPLTKKKKLLSPDCLDCPLCIFVFVYICLSISWYRLMGQYDPVPSQRTRSTNYKCKDTHEMCPKHRENHSETKEKSQTIFHICFPLIQRTTETTDRSQILYSFLVHYACLTFIFAHKSTYKHGYIMWLFFGILMKKMKK